MAARDSEEIASIRAAVRALCANYPGEYWRALDRERGYPTEFVNALTEAGVTCHAIGRRGPVKLDVSDQPAVQRFVDSLRRYCAAAPAMW